MDFRGQLSDGGLYNLLQYLAQHKSTGCLAIRQYQGTKGFIFYEQGKIVHIGLGSPRQKGVRRDAEALSVLLDWGEGRYFFQKEVYAPAKTSTTSLDHLLLEATRLMDEANAKGKRLLHEDNVLTAKKADFDKSLSLSFAALQLLGYLNGINSLREIASRKKANLKTILLAAEELVKYGLVEFSSDSVNPVFIHELKQLVISFMGPVGDYLIEDILLDMNVSEQSLPQHVVKDLIDSLQKDIQQESVKHWFSKETQNLCVKYGVVVS